MFSSEQEAQVTGGKCVVILESIDFSPKIGSTDDEGEPSHVRKYTLQDNG